MKKGGQKVTNDTLKYMNILENFPVTSLEERDAMQYAITCMKAYVSRKRIDEMIAAAEKVPVIVNIQGGNDCRLKTPNEMKDEMLAIIHKYCG